MKNLNSGSVIGRITKDVEVRYSQSGTAYAFIGLATNDDYYSKEKSEEVKRVYFLSFKAHGKRIENLAQHLTKGKPVRLTYKLTSYKKDERTEILPEMVELEFLPSAKKDQPAQGQPSNDGFEDW
jgi:single-strand DNA-binding protein